MLGVAGHLGQQLVGDLRDQLGQAAAQHVGHPAAGVEGHRIPAPQPAGQLHLVRVGMDDSETLQRAVGIEHVHRAPVRDLRDREAGHRAQRGLVVERGGEGVAGLGQEARGLFGAPAVGHVDAGADVAAEHAGGEQRRPRGQQPSVLAVDAEQPQLQLERPLVRGGGAELPLPPRPVVRMDAVHPARVPLLVDRPAAELQPSPVEIGEPALRVRHPDEPRGRVRHEAEQPLAVLQLPLRALARRDVLVEDHDPGPPAPIRAQRAEEEPALAPVGGRAGVLDLEALLAPLEHLAQAGQYMRLGGALGHRAPAQLQQRRADPVAASDEGMRLGDSFPGLIDREHGPMLVEDGDVDGQRVERLPDQAFRNDRLFRGAHSCIVCNHCSDSGVLAADLHIPLGRASSSLRPRKG